MLSRLIEMVSFILAKSLENDEEDWAMLRSELTEQLQGRGFKGPEIDMAFEVANRIRSRIEEGTSIPFPLKTNQVYQYLELMKLTKNARGHLLTLLDRNIISPSQREEIVERSFFLDIAEVDVPEVQYLVNQVLGGDNWLGEDSPAMSYSLH